MAAPWFTAAILIMAVPHGMAPTALTATTGMAHTVPPRTTGRTVQLRATTGMVRTAVITPAALISPHGGVEPHTPPTRLMELFTPAAAATTHRQGRLITTEEAVLLTAVLRITAPRAPANTMPAGQLRAVNTGEVHPVGGQATAVGDPRVTGDGAACMPVVLVDTMAAGSVVSEGEICGLRVHLREMD